MSRYLSEIASMKNKEKPEFVNNLGRGTATFPDPIPRW